jgi:hypothetical protein
LAKHFSSFLLQLFSPSLSLCHLGLYSRKIEARRKMIKFSYLDHAVFV